MPTRRPVPWSRFPRIALGHLLELVFPGRCPGCGELLEEPGFLHPGIDTSGATLCLACRAPLITPQSACCERCGGKRFHEAVGPGASDGGGVAGSTEASDDSPSRVSAERSPPRPCMRCRDTFFQFHRVVALGEYDNQLRKLVLRMKTDRGGQLASAVAGVLWEERAAGLREISADLIVPVPMHAFRRFWRGVNGPDFIAEELGRRLELPVAFHLVRRTKPTRPQFPLTPNERTGNLRDAFSISHPRMPFGRKRLAGAVEGKRILLVDDILTTGSTCNALAKVLLDAGAESLSVAVLARAEGQRERRRKKRDVPKRV